MAEVLSTPNHAAFCNSCTVVCCLQLEALRCNVDIGQKKILASCSGWWIDKAYQMCNIFGDNKRTLKQLRLQGLSIGFQWLPSLFRVVTPMTMLSRWLLQTQIQFHLTCSHPWLCKNCLAPPDARRWHSDIFHPKICKRHTSQQTNLTQPKGS